MEYLKEYSLTDNDIKEIKLKIDERDQFEISTNKERVNEIIKYLTSIGICNIKEILLYKSNIFYDNVNSIKKVLDGVDSKMIKAINEDVFNFDLIGI